MRISKKAEYALRALAAIARQPKCWQIQELSGRENIPIKFLEQILLALRHAWRRRRLYAAEAGFRDQRGRSAAHSGRPYRAGGLRGGSPDGTMHLPESA